MDFSKLAIQIKNEIRDHEKKLDDAREKCRDEIKNNFESAFNNYISGDYFRSTVIEKLKENESKLNFLATRPFGKSCEEYHKIYYSTVPDFGAYCDSAEKKKVNEKFCAPLRMKISDDGDGSSAYAYVKISRTIITYSIYVCKSKYFPEKNEKS